MDPYHKEEKNIFLITKKTKKKTEPFSVFTNCVAIINRFMLYRYVQQTEEFELSFVNFKIMMSKYSYFVLVRCFYFVVLLFLLV